MGRKSATSSSDPGRGNRGRDDARRLVAERSARLILEGGLTDWSLAKRKAARQLSLTDARALPDDDEITAALQVLQSLFQPDQHAAQLRAKRIEALDWMRRLARFSPLLAGGVAEGWATEFSETRLDLLADSVKEVEFALLQADIPYRALGSSMDGGAAELGVAGAHGPVLLVVNTASARRGGTKNSAVPRLSAAELETLVAGS
ncbi:hypothetical protein BURK2_00680 [Burkholderiales bacterium]|nr:MAG: hypothetical protein F9K47_08590 [Burkholderiales bacterium]CAG0960013.1 hypothetical protein BURK2_00680 [Burkholderiales bacterium]